MVTPRLEQFHSLLACCHVDSHGLAGFIKGDRQGEGRDFGNLHQVIVDQHPERPAERLRHGQNRNTITDSVGMIGNDHERTIGQIARRPLGPDIEPYIDQLKHAREDMPALRNDLPAPGLVEPEVAIAAGQAFDRSDDPALEARLVLVGVAELIEAHGDSRRMTMSLRMPRLHESHVTTGAAWFGLPRRKGIRLRAKPSPHSCAERRAASPPRPASSQSRRQSSSIPDPATAEPTDIDGAVLRLARPHDQDNRHLGKECSRTL
jgi:hypothetical protein